MWIPLWLATMATSLMTSAEPAQEHKQRIDVATALRSMVTEACERNFADDADGVSNCLETHLDPATESNERLWLDGHEGDHVCLLNGGVLAERMPACVEAMSAWMAAEREPDLGATFRALGQMFVACVADELCAAGE